MSTQIRPRDPETDGARPPNCNPIKTPCDKIWTNKPATKEEQEALLQSCCRSGVVCEDDSGLGSGFTTLVVNAYIKNSKLIKGNSQKTCIGRSGRPCGDLTEYDLLIDLSPPPDPEDKAKQGEKIKRGCATGENIGKNNKPEIGDQKEVKRIGNFPIRIPINILPGWNGKDEENQCPIVIPLLNLNIPNKRKCVPTNINQQWGKFLATCKSAINDNVIIPGVCGDITPCDWTHLYQSKPPKEASTYYEDGLLKNVVNSFRIIKPGYEVCKIQAKALMNADGSGPKDTSGNPLLSTECRNAFGFTGISPDKFASINCPSSDFLTLCDMFQCMDDGKTNEDNVGVDDDENIIDINTSNINVSIVARNKETVASECLNGETPKSYQYSSDGTIYIDIHFGSDCGEDNVDQTYKGIAICKAKNHNCDTISNFCVPKEWAGIAPEKGDQFSDLCEEGYIISHVFECIDANSDRIEKLLNSPECKPNPEVWCCEEPAISTEFANELTAVPLSQCCGRENYNILGKTIDMNKDVAERLCKPKVACCMAPPEQLEGTCVYSQPGQIVSTVLFKYYYSAEITKLKTLIQPNLTNFESPTQTQTSVTKIVQALGLSYKSTIWPLEVRLGLRQPPRDGYGWKGTLTPQNTQQYYNEVLKFLFTNEDFVDNINQFFLTETKNFSRTLEFNVENCDKQDAIDSFYLVNHKAPLNTLGSLGDEAIAANTFIDYLAGLGVVAFNNRKNPTEITPRRLYDDAYPERAEVSFKPCVNTNWTIAKMRSTTYAACLQSYRRVIECCGEKWRFAEGEQIDNPNFKASVRFIPDLVNEDLSTTEVKIDCSVDPRTGELTCNNLPENVGGNKCFIVQDTQYKAANACIRRNGKVVATESRTKILTKCPDDVDCNDLEDPPAPQPTPPTNDKKNPLDPPTVPNPNPPPDAPVDEDDPPAATACACISINNEPTQKVNLPIIFRENGVDYNLDSPQKLNEYLNKYASPPFSNDGKINISFLHGKVVIALELQDRPSLRFTYKMIPCDCDKEVPDNPNAPNPRQDEPTSPPKGNPQQPPENIECNNKVAELKALQNQLALLKTNLESAKQAVDSNRASFNKHLKSWNNNCNTYIENIPILNWFYRMSSYCNSVAINIARTWNGADDLPTNFPPMGTVLTGLNGGKLQQSPVVVAAYKTYEEISKNIETVNTQISEVQTFLNENCGAS